MAHLSPCLLDWYLDEIRQQLRWDVDNSNCCSQMPDEDESVFVSGFRANLASSLTRLQYFRNFITENGGKIIVARA